jgi:DinB superfamily
MSERDDVTRSEAEAWASFERLLDAVPHDEREAPVLDDGWSLKDVLAHIGYWWDDVADAMDQGTYADDPEDTDVINERVRVRSSGMTWVEVSSELEQARARMLATWNALPQVTDIARDAFESETIEHYAEHVEQVERLGRPSR